MGIKKTLRARKTTVGTIGVSAFSFLSNTYRAEGLEITIGNHRHGSNPFRYSGALFSSGTQGRVFSLAGKVFGRFGSVGVLGLLGVSVSAGLFGDVKSGC